MNYRENNGGQSSSTYTWSWEEDSQDSLGVLSSPSSNYYVQAFLGEGCFGQVVKCLKVSTGEMVAVKMIKENSMTPEARNEMAMLEYLRKFDADRFNFVKSNDGFIDHDIVCFDLEMLELSLVEFIELKPTKCLSVKEIRPILQQMATTLEFLSNHGIVHTDIKPDNIMLVDLVNQPLRVKMIDFGLARHVSQAQWGSFLQPLCYRAPEVILGIPYTTAIDMWSLGCVVAELFLGRVLYRGSCEYHMLRNMVNTQGQLPQKLLNHGLKTKWFFRKERRHRSLWRLMTPFEYGRIAGQKNSFHSFADMMTSDSDEASLSPVRRGQPGGNQRPNELC
ncbi:homeodomain-interacting protein kinase 1-like [Nelusetta ayraudi]|uniref:homeodomain-interacting protein kinase 1-like n=1 Tax=Nelusetta ayraudi TaxID=303726 RepID=UPI003F6F8361